jgi:hypothetical protein
LNCVSTGNLIDTVLIRSLAQIGGLCIPWWTVAQFLFFFVPFTMTDLINISISNAQVNDLAELYSEAQHEIRELTLPALRSLAGTPGDVARAEALKGLSAHLSLLESYLRIERVKTRLGGYVVGFGMVRTVVATMITAMIALWTVLRAAGVFFTMETMCPAPT